MWSFGSLFVVSQFVSDLKRHGAYVERILWPVFTNTDSGLILGLRPADERRRYKVTPSLIDWAQT